MYVRKGALFVDYIRREKIDDVDLLKDTFRKIHQIPAEIFSKNILIDWKYSSYNSYLHENKTTNINRKFMLSLFSNKEDFFSFQQKFT